MKIVKYYLNLIFLLLSSNLFGSSTSPYFLGEQILTNKYFIICEKKEENGGTNKFVIKFSNLNGKEFEINEIQSNLLIDNLNEHYIVFSNDLKSFKKIYISDTLELTEFFNNCKKLEQMKKDPKSISDSFYLWALDLTNSKNKFVKEIGFYEFTRTESSLIKDHISEKTSRMLLKNFRDLICPSYEVKQLIELYFLKYNKKDFLKYIVNILKNNSKNICLSWTFRYIKILNFNTKANKLCEEYSYNFYNFKSINEIEYIEKMNRILNP